MAERPDASPAPASRAGALRWCRSRSRRRRPARPSSWAAAGQLVADIDMASSGPTAGVGRGGPTSTPVLRVAPIDVAIDLLGAAVWRRSHGGADQRHRPEHAAVSAPRRADPSTSTPSTSAARSTTSTTPSSTARPTSPTRARRYEEELHDELALITAAEGRTLALFTS